MTLRYLVLVILAASCTSAAAAQTVVEDANGRSSYIVPQGGALLGINTAASSAELGFYSLNSERPIFGGASVQAISKEGVSPIFGSGDARPGVALEAVLGASSELGDPASPVSPTIAGGIRLRRTWSEIAIADVSNVESPIAKDIRFAWDAGIHVHLSTTRVPLLQRRLLLAAAVGRRTLDNYADLTKVSVRTTSTATAADGRRIEVTTTEDARSGRYVRQHHTFLDLDATMALLPTASIRVFGRFLPGREEGSVARNAGGVDLGIYKDGGDPILDRRVGLVFQVNENMPGAQHKEFLDRVTLSLTVNVLPVADAMFKSLTQ
jgi:hypothetical protein